MSAILDSAVATETASPAPAPIRASLGTCITFGIGTVGTAVLLNTIAVYFPAMMSTVLGQSAAVGGLLLMVSKLYDVLADIVIGLASDRTRSRWGRRRPYMLAGTLISSLSFLLIFAPPVLHGAWLVAYMAAALIVYSTGYSLFNIPYTALPAETIEGYNERTRVLSWRAFFATAGQLAASAGVAAVIAMGNGKANGFALMAVIGAAIIFTTMGLSFIGSFRLPAPTLYIPRPRTAMTLRERVGMILTNRPFVMLMGAKFLHFIALSGVASTTLLFKLDVLKVGYNGQFILSLSQNITTAVTVPAWVWIARRIGKRWCYISAILITATGGLSWAWGAPGDPVWTLWARGVWLGAGTGGMLLMTFAMLPDVIEYDRNRTGLQREGAYSSIYAVFEKTGFAIGPALFGFYIAASGYLPTTNGQLVEQPRSAIMALYAGTTVIPFALYMISIVFLLFYNLDERRLKRSEREA
jgi:GPH family glycoside/pentoside/hexuronide:cation symporter